MAGRCGRLAATSCLFILTPENVYPKNFLFFMHLYRTALDCIEPHRTVSYRINNVD